jgi:hypothetical protein
MDEEKYHISLQSRVRVKNLNVKEISKEYLCLSYHNKRHKEEIYTMYIFYEKISFHGKLLYVCWFALVGSNWLN